MLKKVLTISVHMQQKAPLKPRPVLTMAGEVIYTDLNFPGGSSIQLELNSPPRPGLSQYPRWHRMSLGVAWAGNVILLGVLIALGVWSNRSSHTHSHCSEFCQKEQNGSAACSTADSSQSSKQVGTGCTCALEDFRISLKQNVCGVGNSSLAEGTGCMLCPPNWLSYRDKCYWVSERRAFWNNSTDDCAKKRSNLAVIKDRGEMEFVKNIKETSAIPTWIGLRLSAPGRNWAWVDGSPLNLTLFEVSGDPDEKSCPAVSGHRIQFEICNTPLSWICQKQAVQI